jgi:phosphate transport system permease protein
VGTAASIGAVCLTIIPLIAVVGFVIVRGAPYVNWHFLTSNPAMPGSGYPSGIAASLEGTVLIVGVASAMGIPMGLLSGIFLAQNANSRFAGTVRFCCDVIAGLPSILAGILVAVLVVVQMRSPSGFAASLALALLMFPTVTRATEAALLAVPAELREAALGLGATEWKTIFRILIPTASSGIITAVILGIARVTGETAPLVFTISFLGYPFPNTNMFHGFMPALTGQIYVASQSSFPQDRASALGGALVLFAIVMFLNLLARGLTYRLAKRTRLV